MADVVPIKNHRAFERHEKRSAEQVLRDVKKRRPTDVLVVGYDEDGYLFVSASPPDPCKAVWLLERAKLILLDPD